MASSFRRRNEIISGPGRRQPERGLPPSSRNGAVTSSSTAPAPLAATPSTPRLPGVRPSPLNGISTTSTGTGSLDSLLAGHGGFALGHSILLEEPGTTDYASVLLRNYAAEGLLQSQTLTILGFDSSWVHNIPGVASSRSDSSSASAEKMKIAWRYERLSAFGSGIGGSRAEAYATVSSPESSSATPFCHTYDLTKRLSIPSSAKMNFVPLGATSRLGSMFGPILEKLVAILEGSPSDMVHRIVIPGLLNPAVYPPHASSPTILIPFLHSLRGLLRRYSKRVTAMISLSTELYPRDTGLVRWIEILCDGVFELYPLPRRMASKDGDEPQGLFKVWKLPVLSEKGGGIGQALPAGGEDLAFLVTRRRFEIMAYSLPPADAEDGGGGGGGKTTKVDLDF